MTKIDDFIIDELEEVSSTQVYAKELIDKGQVVHGKVITAEIQNSGRGRYDRSWVTSRGNVALTIVLDSASNDQQICYVSGLAILNAIKKYVPLDKIKLKWVNDILIDEKKICGILLEKVGDFLLVGIGLNLKYEEGFPSLSATSLDQFNSEFSRDEIIENILDNFKSKYNAWLDFGFQPVRQEWLRHAYKLKHEVRVNLPDSNVEVGKMLDIDDEGYLVLGTSEGEKRIAVGELFNL